MNTDVDPEQLREATRALLARPMLSSGGPHAAIAATVRRPQYKAHLQQWFENNLGWKLVVDRDVVRLNKIPTSTPCQPEDAPEQRVCVLYCLILAALEESGDQVVITEIADAVTSLSSSRTEIATFDSTNFSERRHLVRSLRMLVEHGALVPTRDSASTEQDESEYVTGSGNAIYDVDHRVVALVLACPIAPTRAGTPAALTNESLPDTQAGHNRQRKQLIMRRLVDEPVLYQDELTTEEQDYFRSQRHALIREVEDMLGVQVEVRAEGAAVIDEQLTDIRFPQERTAPYAALLLAGALATEPGVSTHDKMIVPWPRLHELGSWLAAQVGERVKTIESKPITESSVLEAALVVLAVFRLVERTTEGVLVRPALGRFRQPVDAPPPAGGHSHADLHGNRGNA